MFELYGTGTLVDVPGGAYPVTIPGDTYFQTYLDPNVFTWQNVAYPVSGFPMNTAIATGVTNLTAAINNLITSQGDTAEFVLIGWGQGASVVSNVYDEIRASSLNSNLKGGVTFGNPRRQGGHTFPGGPDPGGEGIDFNNLLTSTEARWWDFANPGDDITVNDHSTISGQINTALWEMLNASLAGDLTLLVDLFTHPVQTIVDGFYDLFYTLWNIVAGPHQQYQVTTPLGDGRTCVEIALNYVQSLGDYS